MSRSYSGPVFSMNNYHDRNWKAEIGRPIFRASLGGGDGSNCSPVVSKENSSGITTRAGVVVPRIPIKNIIPDNDRNDSIRKLLRTMRTRTGWEPPPPTPHTDKKWVPATTKWVSLTRNGFQPRRQEMGSSHEDKLKSDVVDNSCAPAALVEPAMVNPDDSADLPATTRPTMVPRIPIKPEQEIGCSSSEQQTLQMDADLHALTTKRIDPITGNNFENSDLPQQTGNVVFQDTDFSGEWLVPDESGEEMVLHIDREKCLKFEISKK